MGGAELRVVCGPTAAGKSALAMALAARHDVELVSADSRQVYRRFDIGTAKPSVADRARVPHHGIDVADPWERYSAARWAESARRWIAGVETRGRPPLVVGGTGFYIRALTRPLFEEPELEPTRRAALAAELEALDLPELRRWCARLDPPRADLGRTQLLRALEVALLTGTPISEWHRRSARAAPLRARYLVVDPGPALEARIADRIRAMIHSGWEDEVRALLRQVPDDAPAWNASGYRAIRDLVTGRATRADAIERVRLDTRQYAKRQRTWIRHQLPAGSVTALDPLARGAVRLAEAWWVAEGAA